MGGMQISGAVALVTGLTAEWTAHVKASLAGDPADFYR